MIISFEHELHDESYETLRSSIEMSGFDVSDDLAELIGRPFYSVILSCTLDTETGRVEVVDTKLEP